MIGTSRPPGMTINMSSKIIGVSSKSSYVIFFYCSNDCISKKFIPNRFCTTFSTFDVIMSRISLSPLLQKNASDRKPIKASTLSVISSSGMMNMSPMKVSMKNA